MGFYFGFFGVFMKSISLKYIGRAVTTMAEMDWKLHVKRLGVLYGKILGFLYGKRFFLKQKLKRHKDAKKYGNTTGTEEFLEYA